MPFFKLSELSFENKFHDITCAQNNVVIASIGKGSFVVDMSLECGDIDKVSILIGNYCSIAHACVALIGLNHYYKCVGTFPAEHIFGIKMSEGDAVINHHQIVIGHEVWIGRGALIFGGVHIGNGAIIGANAVVTKDVPPYAIVVGNPGRVVKYRFSNNEIEALQKIKWWYWDEQKLKSSIADMVNVESFINKYLESGSTSRTICPEAKSLKELKAEGYSVAGVDVDFDMPSPLCIDFIKLYCEKYQNSSKIVLVLFVDNSRVSSFSLLKLQKTLDSYGDNAPIIFAYNYDVDSMPIDILSTLNIFYFTRSCANTVFFDYLYGSEVDLKYILDKDIWLDA